MEARKQTVNLRSPLMAELSSGAHLTSPTGEGARVAGRSLKEPGRITVVFHTPKGEETRHVWPADLRGFRTVDGVTL